MADPYQAPLIFADPHDDAAKVNTQLIGAADRIADRGTWGPALDTANRGSRSNRTFHIDADGLRERASAVRIEGLKPDTFGSRPASAAPAPVIDISPLGESDATASRKTTLRCAQAALTPARAERDRLEAEMNDRIENSTMNAHFAGAIARAKAAAAKERARAAGAAARKTSGCGQPIPASPSNWTSFRSQMTPHATRSSSPGSTGISPPTSPPNRSRA